MVQGAGAGFVFHPLPRGSGNHELQHTKTKKARKEPVSSGFATRSFCCGSVRLVCAKTHHIGHVAAHLAGPVARCGAAHGD